MFRCAFYEREITPPLGCDLPGYGSVRRGSDVKDRLMAKAFVINSGNETFAFVTVDACAIYFEVRNEIAKRISQHTGIKMENVLVAAIHTHTGIPDKYRHIDDDAFEDQKGYFDIFPKLIADCAILAYKRLEESELTFGVGDVKGISFCRDYIMKSSTPRTNPGRLNPDIAGPASPIDTELPVLFVKGVNGKPIGAVITFACHLDCVDGTEYSGDIASEISSEFKRIYGNDFVTLFFMGTAGDINHFNVNTAGDAPDHYRRMGQKIVGEAIKVISFAEPVIGDTLLAKYEILEIERRKIAQEEIDRALHIVNTVKPVPGVKIAADNTSKELYELMMSKKLLDFHKNTEEVYEVPLHFVQIGDVKFYGYPGEIFCHFGITLKKKCNTNKRIVASYCNRYLGYVPTRDMFYDTIYESLPGSSRLDTEAGYMMTEKLLEMGQ